MIQKLENPFQIMTPEQMSSEDVFHLFVESFPDFPKILTSCHLFINGPRGTGKSMLFRYLMPECQCLKNKCNFKDLPFFSFYIPLKNFNFITELKSLDETHGSNILNTHLLTVHCLEVIFGRYKEYFKTEFKSIQMDEVIIYFNDIFIPALENITWKQKDELRKIKFESSYDVIDKIHKECLQLYNEINTYCSRLAVANLVAGEKSINYGGALSDFDNFLLPLLRGIKDLSFMCDAPIFLLIDDADVLSETLTKVLNSWVFKRTTNDVSLKISTQLSYKTYETSLGSFIEYPHDYYEINLSTIFTGNYSSKYPEIITKIVEKRFKIYQNIDIKVEDYFPSDVKQEEEIEKIKQELKKLHEQGKGRGTNASDDVTRYARPNYIKSLSGTSKSSSTYSYSGFEQLVHISSGIIRYFLEAAFAMYAETKIKFPKKIHEYVPDNIQDDIIRSEANKFLFDNMEKVMKDSSKNKPSSSEILNLSNLINALGGLFRLCLLSDRSERKVISIAISDTQSELVEKTFDLGVRLGYFHKKTIGRKESQLGGRTRLYVLSRRLAPIWTLDPSGFAGYLFIKNDLLENAIKQPNSLLARIRRRGVESELESTSEQLAFDFSDKEGDQ